MKKHINHVLIFVAVAALVVATLEYKRLLASAKINNSAAAAILKRNAAMKAQIDTLKPTTSQPTHTGDTVTDVDASTKIAAAGKANVKTLAQWHADADAYVKMVHERVKNDSEFALKYYASQRADLEMVYAPFYRVHHLSNEQCEALGDAKLQWRLRVDDIQSGVDAKAIRKAADDEFASNAKAVLGDDLYEQLLDYERQRPAWGFVSTYGSDVSLVDMPLNVEQASQLADAIANACPAFQEGKPVDMSKVDWNAVDAAAVDFLTPEQMNFLKNAAVNGSGHLMSWPPRQNQELDNALQKPGQ